MNPDWEQLSLFIKEEHPEAFEQDQKLLAKIEEVEKMHLKGSATQGLDPWGRPLS